MAGLIFFVVSRGSGEHTVVEPLVPAVAAVPVYRRVAPASVKALYVTMHTAGIAQKMEKLIDLAKRTEVNAMVIDVKGSQGELAFDYLDLKKLNEQLHEAGIWTIARIVVFQDNGAVKRVPDAMIQNKNGGVWRDPRGFAWLDPAAVEGWNYILDVSKRALDAQFDEINYDYIRFPSDGRLDRAAYPAWKENIPKSKVIADFAKKARETLKAYAPDMTLSMDMFGYAFLSNGDLGIGQQLEDLIEPFDGVYPMVYPSHYRAGNFGFANPAEHPYEVVKGTLEKGLERFGEKGMVYAKKIRPWLQAF
ncbi:hypothetical protein HYR65_01085, partial [Candidatus Azambacteria bacterium]|nr:hypothetical protein [Candidatus Azambacteria bacterium]